MSVSRMKISVLAAVCVLWLLALRVISFASEEPSFAVPELSIEVKFNLDPDRVLDERHLFTEEFLRMFNVQEDPRAIDVVFLETPDRKFDAEGWINRLRLKDGKKKFEKTYKKRYSVPGPDPTGINSALNQAIADGFAFSDEAYSAEIDWSYSKMTLSVSVEVSAKHPQFEQISRFDAESARSFVGETMPVEEADWKEKGWGLQNLQNAQTAGPVRSLRFKGSWEELDEVTIELWPVEGNNSTDYIAELSYKSEQYEQAAGTRARLAAFLEEKGILLHSNAMKTTRVLDAYLPKAPEDAQQQTEETEVTPAPKPAAKKATIKVSRKTVPQGKSKTVKITADSGVRLTVRGENAFAKNRKYVKITNGRTAKLKFRKKAKKGLYKFVVTAPAKGSFRKTQKTITIRVK